MALKPITADQACAIANAFEVAANTLHDLVEPRGIFDREVRHALHTAERARREVDNLANLLSTRDTRFTSCPSTTSNYRRESA